MQSSDIVEVEFRKCACGFGACLRDDSIGGVSVEGKKRCEAVDRESVRGAGATNDDGEDANLVSTGPMVYHANVGGGRLRGGVFVANELCGALKVVVFAVFPFPSFLIYLTIR
jgi:hypothetical protein